jgi:hypothetical protein
MLIPWFLLSTFDLNFIIYAVIVNIVLMLGQLPEFKIYFRLRKEGKQNDYKERLLELTAQMRGLKKMENVFRSMGKWRIIIAVLTVLGTITIFSILPFLNF